MGRTFGAGGAGGQMARGGLWSEFKMEFRGLDERGNVDWGAGARYSVQNHIYWRWTLSLTGWPRGILFLGAGLYSGEEKAYGFDLRGQ
jgi:hypothetical protein